MSTRTPAEFVAHPSDFPGGTFRAVCRQVIDGDTLDVLLDLGFSVYVYHTLRVAGIDTPEIRSRDAEEKTRGFAAKERTRALVDGNPILVRSRPDPQTFGRYVADVSYQDEGTWKDLAETLKREGHAK